VHDHWVDGIGNDVITDFNKAQGDKITITGHTTEVSEIKIADGDGQADDSVLQLRSNQGNAGAHHLDQLGTISVLNNKLTANDFTVDANSTAISSRTSVRSRRRSIQARLRPWRQWAAAPALVRRTGTPEGTAGASRTPEPMGRRSVNADLDGELLYRHTAAGCINSCNDLGLAEAQAIYREEIK
jgi:hypothetical protein